MNSNLHLAVGVGLFLAAAFHVSIDKTWSWWVALEVILGVVELLAWFLQ